MIFQPRTMMQTCGRFGATASIAITLLHGIHAETAKQAPWETARSLSDFQALLRSSPFSLPTAEESSPLAERYAITGIVTIGGEEQLFIFDKTDQSRDVVTHTPNSKKMSLVSLVREGSTTPQKATIQVDGETGIIGYKEASPQQAVPPQTQVVGSFLEGPASNPRLPRFPQLPHLPQQPVVSASQPPTLPDPAQRRIIRRTTVNPPKTSTAPLPTQ